MNYKKQVFDFGHCTDLMYKIFNVKVVTSIRRKYISHKLMIKVRQKLKVKALLHVRKKKINGRVVQLKNARIFVPKSRKKFITANRWIG